MVDRAAIGRRSARIGKEGERGVLKALRDNGYPNAEPKRVEAADRLDINLCPGVVASVKAGEYARSCSIGDVSAWHAEAEAKRIRVGAEFALLIIQRRGYGMLPDRVLHWRTWVIGDHAKALRLDDPIAHHLAEHLTHAELQLARALEMLRLYGYGGAS